MVTTKTKSTISNKVSNPECYEEIDIKALNNIEWSINNFLCDISGDSSVCYSTTHNNYVFEIYFSTADLENKTKELNQILLTFRFIEIEKPYIKVISPNGGEEWVIGNTYDIVWEAKGLEKVDIAFKDYKYTPPQIYSIVSEIPASLGKYSFTIGSTEIQFYGFPPGERYKILVIDEMDLPYLAVDESDNYFTIVKKNETVNWETYRNEEYGFEIGYPQKEEGATRCFGSTPYLFENIKELLCIYLDHDFKEKIIGIQFGIMIKEKPDDIFTECIKPSYDKAGFDGPEEVIIGDLKFCKSIILNPAIGGTRWLEHYYSIKIKNKYLFFSFIIDYESCDKCQFLDNLDECYANCKSITEYEDQIDQFINQILSTFRFLE